MYLPSIRWKWAALIWCNMTYSLVAEGFYTEKNGTKINLVPLDAEFSAEQHIQNPLKSPLENLLNIYFNFLLSNIK